MTLYPIDLLNIRDKDLRKKHYKKLLKNADEHKKVLLESYMELAEKNQSEDFKKYTRFLKIFPQYFANSPSDFFNDDEIETVKKLLLDLEIRLNIFDQNKTTQCIFWYMLFNFMTPLTGEIKITTARRKLLAEKYCSKKADPDSRSLQNVFRSLTNSGLLVKKYKDKHNVTYGIPLIVATRSFNKQYIDLNMDYLDLLHDIQTNMIKRHLNEPGMKIDNEKIKQKIAEQVTDDLVGKISYQKENVKLKVTYELECNSSSGEITFGNLVDVIDIKKNEDPNESQILIDKYIANGNSLKPKQIQSLIANDFYKLSLLYQTDPIMAKKSLRDIPTIGRLTYRAICEFLSNQQ
jgi:hypothetical protein